MPYWLVAPVPVTIPNYDECAPCLASEAWESRNSISQDLPRSRDHGPAHILDEECLEGVRVFFRRAAEIGVLPAYELPVHSAAF